MEWALDGECVDNREYMSAMCPEACAQMPDQEWEYVGCFKDDEERDFRYGPQTEGFNIDTCRDECREYPYFALQNNGFCSCDYTYGTPADVYQQTDDSECDGGMGGAWRNAVYKNNLFV